MSILKTSAFLFCYVPLTSPSDPRSNAVSNNQSPKQTSHTDHEGEKRGPQIEKTKDASPKKDLDAMDFDFSKKKILYDKEVSVKKQYFMFGPLCGTCIYGIKEIKF